MASRRLFGRIWRRGRNRGPVVTLDLARDLPEKDEARLRDAVTGVLGRHDVMTRRAQAGAIADAYLTLDDGGKERFFRMLARDFWIDPDEVAVAANALQHAHAPLERRAAENELRAALAPPAGKLLRLF